MPRLIRITTDVAYEIHINSDELQRLNCLLKFATNYNKNYPDILRGIDFDDLRKGFDMGLL